MPSPVDAPTAGIFSALGGALAVVAKAFMERRSSEEKRLDERDKLLWERLDSQLEGYRNQVDEQGRQIAELKLELEGRDRTIVDQNRTIRELRERVGLLERRLP